MPELLDLARDVARHRRRAVHRGEDAEIVARARLAVGAAKALEGRLALDRQDRRPAARPRRSRSRARNRCTTQLCSCTHWPGAIGFEAKPMIWPNLRIGSPTAIGAVAILWPRGDALDRDRRADRRVAGTDFVDGDHRHCLAHCRRRARGALMGSTVLAGPSGRNQLGSLARERFELPGRLGEMSRPSRRAPTRRRPQRSRRRSPSARRASG